MNSAGVSGPFNPLIGSGLAQDGTAAPVCIIGVSAANLVATVATFGPQQSALGNFIGQQGRTSAQGAGYSESHPPPNDFDTTFACQAVVAGAQAATNYKASSNGFFFG